LPVLERLESEARKLNDMISQLLTLSRLEAGSENVTMHQLNLRQLVEQVIADAAFEAEARGRSVKLVRAEDCYVLGSERLLRSAVENVLRNAVRYTKEGTEVEVALKNGDGNATVMIRDYGDGVPESELKNLFRPFYRVSESRDRGSGGTGLGLAIAEQAIRLHRGRIEARNSEPGLTVEIRLECLNS